MHETQLSTHDYLSFAILECSGLTLKIIRSQVKILKIRFMRKFKYMKRKCLKRGKKATSLSLKNAKESNALILFIKLAEIFFSNYSSQDEGKIGITFLESNLFGTFYDDALKERTGSWKHWWE